MRAYEKLCYRELCLFIREVAGEWRGSAIEDLFWGLDSVSIMDAAAQSLERLGNGESPEDVIDWLLQGIRYPLEPNEDEIPF